ncbi:site-specific integrase [Microvirga roseola]|uniref:site-specific integrase n=1 Tax=Microvirga roseola TaxID=2883126 RepID=UPI001E4FEEFF|nr:site-specific integrase [Microvirga roseola]
MTHKQVLALAGEVYRTFTAACEEDPDTPELWASVTHANVRALHGRYGRAALLIASDQEKRAKSLADRFGPFVDVVLAKRSLVVDADSRARLVEQVGVAMREAGERLFLHAQGDYGPDTQIDRFPTWTEPAEPPKQPTGRFTLTGLFEKLANERAYSPKTRAEWARSVKSLVAHVGTDDPERITTEAIIAWTDDLVAKGLTAKTINDAHLAAVKALFKWAKAKRYVSSNPALEVPKVERRDEGQAERGYTLAEAEAVLRAASREKNPVRRWLPWLMAYSGARAGEVAQLRRQDVRQEPETGFWYLDINPAAGRLKNKPSARAVPLHPHLIELGFVEWVATQSRERLFYEEKAERGDRRSRRSVTINRLGDWVRGLGLPGVVSGEVAPNHGWRHRVATELVNLEVPDTIRKRLLGHALHGQDNRYVGRIVMERLHDAVARLPRYAVSEDAKPEIRKLAGGEKNR